MESSRFCRDFLTWSRRKVRRSGASFRSLATAITHIEIRVMFRSVPVMMSKKFRTICAW